MVNAVGNIHRQKVTHSSLIPSNFVLVKDVIKLIDFGATNAFHNDFILVLAKQHDI
jgi:tRNA A-37 threonylcarbamoyl transferase component Bud32